jgi:hypothetical protein
VAKVEGGQAIACFHVSDQQYPLRNCFILDSGTTTHICNNIERMRDLCAPVPGDFIWAGNTQVWIQGYGTVQITTKGQTAEQTIQLENVAFCPDILCNLVSFRLLRLQGIWWDNRGEPTMLRRQDDSIVAILTEMHQQWVVDLQHGHAAFYVRTSSKTPRAVQKTSATL